MCVSIGDRYVVIMLLCLVSTTKVNYLFEYERYYNMYIDSRYELHSIVMSRYNGRAG